VSEDLSLELPKVEASEFIVTVSSGGRVSGDLTLQKDFTSEVCVCEYFGIRRSIESRSNPSCPNQSLRNNLDFWKVDKFTKPLEWPKKPYTA
jgi:hypothetical protein